MIAISSCRIILDVQELRVNLTDIQRGDADTRAQGEALENKIELLGYSLKDVILYQHVQSWARAAITKIKANTIISAWQKMYGYSGVEKCDYILREDLYCRNLYRVTRKILASCVPCQKNNVYMQGSHAESRNILPNHSSDLVYVDFYGLHEMYPCHDWRLLEIDSVVFAEKSHRCSKDPRHIWWLHSQDRLTERDFIWSWNAVYWRQVEK